MRARVGFVGAALCVVAAVAAGGCTVGRTASTSSEPSVRTSVVATRWWTTSKAAAGSVIDAKAPGALAAKLHPSRTDYCSMLRQTIAVGGSILPDAGANDPARLVATQAFVQEIEHVAPSPVAPAWQVLGPALLALVTSGGDAAKIKDVDPTKVRAAAKTVAADARAQCGLDVSVPN